MSNVVNVLSLSGGKDSTALRLLAREMGVEVLSVFADTGHEHDLTYEYLDYLEREIGPIKRVKADFAFRIAKKREYVINHWPRKLTADVPGGWYLEYSEEDEATDKPDWIPEDQSVTNVEVKTTTSHWIWIPEQKGMSEEEAAAVVIRALAALYPSGNPFLDLCIWKGRFPSTKARFCTTFLKVFPIEEDVYLPLIAAGNDIVSWQGIRADESLARRDLPERESTGGGMEIYRPLIKWTVEDVFEMHRKYGIEPNPLYKLGMGRVGCMPCINSNKAELFEIARRFPEVIARIREWESIVKMASKRQAATFFPTAHGQGTGIDEWVEWSKTSYGGRNYDLMKHMDFADVPQCSSIYGLCE